MRLEGKNVHVLDILRTFLQYAICAGMTPESEGFAIMMMVMVIR